MSRNNNSTHNLVEKSRFKICRLFFTVSTRFIIMITQNVATPSMQIAAHMPRNLSAHTVPQSSHILSGKQTHLNRFVQDRRIPQGVSLYKNAKGN